MINPDHPRSAKLLFSKEELAPDERPQATKATQKQPKKVKPAQKKAESPQTQPVDRADEHIPAENNKLKRDRSFLRDSDQDVNDQRASNRQLYEKQTELQQREVAITEKKLDAEIRKKAEAEKFAAQQSADARLYTIQKNAEAVAKRKAFRTDL